MQKGAPLQAEDAELWLQLQADNYQALAQLYQRHGQMLLTYGCRLCENEDLVKDCIQDFFVELWNRRLTLPNDIQHIKLYFLGAIRHKINRAARQQEKQEGWATDYETVNPELSYESLLIQLEDEAAQTTRLREAIALLAPRQQEVIHLRFFQNLSHAETATLMDLRVQSVRNLLHVALIRLREQLDFSIQIPVFCLFGFYC